MRSTIRIERRGMTVRKLRERPRTMTRRLGEVTTRIWCADDLGPAELLRGRFVDYSYDLHTHDKACFALLTRGAIRIRMRGREMVARAGDLYAINADEPHAGSPIDRHGWSLRTLYVDLALLYAQLIGERSGTPALAGPIIRDAQLASLFAAVHADSEKAGPPLERAENYARFVARLFAAHVRGTRRDETPGREDRALRLVRDFLDHRLDQRVSLAELAAVAGLPPFRMLRAFQRATGMSPHAYQRQARVRFAADLIRLGHALSEVAVVAGFADQAHLTRAFRHAIAVTPGAYQTAFAPARRR
jgi:AraC-like DNA-binding protein